MKNKTFDTELLQKKNQTIDNAIKILKEEFVGIDKQIDEIMYNVRTWYLYPQLQVRPLVVSVWGMSGNGKTSLIKRISQLLDIEKDFVYWNFASITESASWEIENQIEEELANETTNRMFVYDEFQYAATINPKSGEERESKSGLKPFWELLDTGIIHKRSQFWTVRVLFKIIDYITKINSKCRMEINNGVWTNTNECLSYFERYDVIKFGEVFNFERDETLNMQECSDGKTEKCKPIVENKTNNNKDFFIRENYLERLLEIYDKVSDKVIDQIEFYHKLEKLDIEGIVELISEIHTKATKGYDLNFNNSIIFVIGNLDEAYEMSFDVNPDMSPDQFRKVTEKISIVDIKDALKRRFRNEQIARLGNIHVIYPSFSEQNFKDIIDLALNKYEESAFKLTGLHLKFDESIKNIIYEEGVYPTHGTRPLFSTIQEIVKSRLPEIMRSIVEQHLENEVTVVEYCFNRENNKIFVNCLKDDEKITTVEFDTNLRLKQLRDSGVDEEEQAICALHESGHFVMYAKLFGKMPEKLVSRTTDSNTGGFLMEDFDSAKKKVSKHDMLNEMKVLLGGYVAEKMLFGEEMTAGASNDIKRATQIASRMVRRFGMFGHVYASSHTKIIDNEHLIIQENQNHLNDYIIAIIKEAEQEVMATFRDENWRNMLKESALYLCDNSSMPKHKMQEIYDNVSQSVKKPVRSSTYYHDTIANM